MMGFPVVIAIYQAGAVFFGFEYDSATYYLKKGDTVSYKAVLSKIFSEEDIEIEINKLKSVELDNHSSKVSDKASTFEVLCGKKYRRMVRVGSVLAFVQQLAGINAVVFYSSAMFQNIGISIFLSRLITFFIGVTSVISSCCTIPILKYIGRKPSLLSGHILIAIDLLITGLLSQFQPDATTGIAVCVCAFFFIFSYSLQSTMWAYLGEIQNTTALSFSSALNFLSNIIVVVAFPYSVSAFGIYSTFYFFAGCMAAGAVYVAVDVFETKNKTIEDIEMEIFSIQVPGAVATEV